MNVTTRRPLSASIRRRLLWFVAVTSVLMPLPSAAQELTATLAVIVRDETGDAVPDALVTITSTLLIGGPKTLTTDINGPTRFLALPPGLYVLEIERSGFATSKQDIYIGAGDTTEAPVTLKVKGVATIVAVDAEGSRLVTRVGPEKFDAIPVRRPSFIDYVKMAPAISPTSPGGPGTLVSAAGSGVDQNQWRIDGTNVTAPTNGVARADPGNDFIQEVRIQSVGVPAEYGNVQGAVVELATKSGSNLFRFDASFFSQIAGLTSQPIRLTYDRARQLESGFERAKYRDFTTSLGGPVVRDRASFFVGYQHVRDYDSQPGTDPSLPRKFETDRFLAKVTWQAAPSTWLVQSLQGESWFNPEVPTSTKPIEATQFVTGSVPTMNFGLTHAPSGNTVWEVHAGLLRFSQTPYAPSGDPTKANRVDQPGNNWSGAPQQVGQVKLSRETAKAAVSHYVPGLFGADHELRIGTEASRGEHRGFMKIPTGERQVYTNGVLTQRVQQEPTQTGGEVRTAAAFVSDTLRLGGRVTLNAGFRFDHTVGISQDVPKLDVNGNETGAVIGGRGTMGTWNTVSPRLFGTIKFDGAGRTTLWGGYGRYSQSPFTGEISPFHPGQTPITTIEEPTINEPLGKTSIVYPADQLQFDPDLRLPYTDQYSIGMDRQIGGLFTLSVAFIHKNGVDFTGWADVGGVYVKTTAMNADGTTFTMPDGRTMEVYKLTNLSSARLFQLTNPKGYSLTYNALVIAAEKRWSHGWRTYASYTFSRAEGMQPSSGTTAAGAQVATVGSPPVAFAAPVTFGRDPNDEINATGRLPNDRPQMFRSMTSFEVPRTGVMISLNLQYYSGKPYAATARINPQDSQRLVLIEPRGSRRLPSQTLFDVRVSRPVDLGRMGHVDLRLDVFNVFNDTAAESVETDVFSDPAFGRANIFMDPRRAMLSVTFKLGRR